MGQKQSKKNMVSPDVLVNQLIQDNKVAVFSKTYCPYCKKTKALFTELKEPFAVMELDVEEGGEAVQEYIKSTYGHRTVPAVFIKGNLLGGCDDTVGAHKSGKLAELLAA